MTEIKFRIKDTKNEQYISLFIPQMGSIISGIAGIVFSSYIEALEYLNKMQCNGLNYGHFVDITRFVIEESEITIRNHTVQNSFEDLILSEPDSEENIKRITSILKYAVQWGFDVMEPTFLQFVLNYDKYQPILSKVVPPHMLNSIGEFLGEGILGCDIDVLGSISLTASEEQHIMYDINDLFKSRTNASK